MSTPHLGVVEAVTPQAGRLTPEPIPGDLFLLCQWPCCHGASKTLCGLAAALDSWVHWAQMGWGHHHILEKPEVSSCTMREVVSSSIIIEGLAGSLNLGLGPMLPLHGHSCGKAASRRPEQATPSTLHPACGAHRAKRAASTQTPLSFCTMSSPPMCPQPCRVTQALSHPPQAPGVGPSLLSHTHLETGIQAPDRADGLSQGMRGRHPRAAYPRILGGENPRTPRFAYLPHWRVQWLQGQSAGLVECLGT